LRWPVIDYKINLRISPIAIGEQAHTDLLARLQRDHQVARCRFFGAWLNEHKAWLLIGMLHLE
jgi:hypothetical protein